METNNAPFPPTSPNGAATAADQAKRTGKPKSRPADRPTTENERPQPATRPAEAAARPNRTERTRQPEKPQADNLTAAQVFSATVSRFVARYPLQSIGGLLGVLLMVLLFKTFYQSKNWKAKRMAEEAYYVANQYARNNGTNLHPYLSQAFRREVRQLPGLLPLSMQTATRGGSITGAESVGLREVTPDSVVVEVALRYENGREEKRYQPLVYEKDQWRLGVTYNK